MYYFSVISFPGMSSTPSTGLLCSFIQLLQFYIPPSELVNSFIPSYYQWYLMKFASEIKSWRRQLYFEKHAFLGSEWRSLIAYIIFSNSVLISMSYSHLALFFYNWTHSRTPTPTQQSSGVKACFWKFSKLKVLLIFSCMPWLFSQESTSKRLCHEPSWNLVYVRFKPTILSDES